MPEKLLNKKKDPSLCFTPLQNLCSDSCIKKFICHFDNLDSCTSCPHNSVDCHYVLCHPASQTSPSYLQLPGSQPVVSLDRYFASPPCRPRPPQLWSGRIWSRARALDGGRIQCGPKIRCPHSCKMLSEQNKQFLKKNTVWNVKKTFPTVKVAVKYTPSVQFTVSTTQKVSCVGV